MSFSGEILFIISIFTILIICLTSLIFYIKKIRWKWWYTSIFALFVLIYFIAGRWGFELHVIFNHHFINNETTANNFIDSYIISKAFLLDMCPFLTFLVSLISICKWTQVFAKIIAPIGLFISSATIFLAISTLNTPLTVQYVFLGNYPNLMFFMMHYLLLILSLILVLTTFKYQNWYFLIAFLVMFLYITYIFIIKTLTGVNWNLTGLTSNDWKVSYQTVYDPSLNEIVTKKYVGEYYSLAKYFHLSYPSGPIFLFLVSMILVIVSIYLNKLTHYYLMKNSLRKLLRLKQIKEFIIVLN